MQQTCIDDVTKMPEGDFAAGYGYFLWRNKNEGYRFNGRYGQFSVILPERCAVVTTTGIEVSMSREYWIVFGTRFCPNYN